MTAARDPKISNGRDGLSTSESEEMYLITMAMAVEDGHQGPVPVPYLADELGVSRVSANEMVKKLAARGLVEYEPYKGVTLLPDGEEIADTVLRRRRLWSLFLHEQLGLTPSAADSVACEFEHVTPFDVANRLSEFLDHPRVGPGGKPIPLAGDPGVESPSERVLTTLQVGQSAEIVGFGSGVIRSFLHAQGIVIGSDTVLLASSDDGDYLIGTPKGEIHLAEGAAASVNVVPAH